MISRRANAAYRVILSPRSPTMLVTGMLTPFNSASRELYAQAKAIPRFWHTINHFSYLRKFPRQKRNKRLFTRPPGPLADYTRTVGTDIFRKCSLPSTRFI